MSTGRTMWTSGLWLALGVAGACGGPPATGGGESTDGGSSGTASTGSSVADSTGSAPDDGGSSTGEAPPAACAAGYPIPPTEQVPGDPEEGYRAMIEEGYVTCGIPYSLFGLAAPLLGEFASGDPLPGRTGKNAEVPYNWTVHISASGAEIVSLNCLECHAGEWDGQLRVGLGKADADYTEDIGGALAQIPVSPIPIPGIEELTRMAQRYQALSDHTRMLTVGSNPADQTAGVLSTYRDGQTLEWLGEPQSPIPEFIVPVDTPPWWHVRKKHGLFFNGMSRGDHRASMIFATSLCTDSVEEAEQILTYFDDIRAYIESIEPPAPELPVDDALVAEGEGIFERDCACCHGTYAATEAEETYPNLLLPLDVVGTDPLLASQEAELPYVGWFNESWYGEIGQLTPDEPFVGYVAPPLDGIWMTAPYFHNGSVPNLALVLDSTRRPQYWRRVDYDSQTFDEASVGWPYLELPYGQDDAPADERKHVYDTTKLGHWNTGHTFGDHLSDQERAAVVEYLKTL